LGDAQRAGGDIAAAGQSWRRAVVIFDHLGHADAEEVRAKLGALPSLSAGGTEDDPRPARARIGD
jgi:hypothetical protein